MLHWCVLVGWHLVAGVGVWLKLRCVCSRRSKTSEKEDFVECVGACMCEGCVMSVCLCGFQTYSVCLCMFCAVRTWEQKKRPCITQRISLFATCTQ